VDTRYHIACVYTGSEIRLFVDGTEQTPATATTVGVRSQTSRILFVGRQGPTTSVALDGSLDELRLSDSARYTGNFTPDAAPFTTDANTLGLYHFDGATRPVLECTIERAAPAHTKPIFNYEE
jgi:hypothetical protein